MEVGCVGGGVETWGAEGVEEEAGGGATGAAEEAESVLPLPPPEQEEVAPGKLSVVWQVPSQRF